MVNIILIDETLVHRLLNQQFPQWKNKASREVFRSTIALDTDTWARGRAWALWKALITAAGFTNPNNTESSQCWQIIERIISEYIELRN